MEFINKIYKYIIAEFRQYYFILCIIFFITSILEIAVTGVSKLFIDGVTNKVSVDTIYHIGIIFLINIIVLLVFQLAKKYLLVYTAERILSSRRSQMYINILSRKTDSNFDGVHRMLVELPMLIDFCVTTIPTFIFDCVSTLILIVLLAILNVKFLLIVFTMIVLNLITFKIMNKKLYTKNQLALQAFTDVTSVFSENVNNIIFINAMNIQEYSINRLSDVLEKGVKARFKIRDIQLGITSITTLISFLPQLLILMFGSINVINNKWSLGDMVIYITFVQYLVSKINNMVNTNINFQNIRAIMENYMKYCDKDIKEYKKTVINKETINKIRADKVKLPYNNIEISAELKKGDFLYIKGSNGSGKTTFIYQLLKLKDVYSGLIHINDKPIQFFDYNINGKSIGIVLQKTYLFNDTIKENIACGRKLGDDQIIDTYQLVFSISIDNEFLNRKISTLSGGERRKVEIIRAIIGKPDIIILDEVDTYLDEKSFNNLISFLYESYKNDIIIMIAHRRFKIDKRVKVLDFDDPKAYSFFN